MAGFSVSKSNADGGATPRPVGSTVVSDLVVSRTGNFMQEVFNAPVALLPGMVEVTPTVDISLEPTNNTSGIHFTPGAVLGWPATLFDPGSSIEVLQVLASDAFAGSAGASIQFKFYDGTSNAAPLVATITGDDPPTTVGPFTGTDAYIEVTNTSAADIWWLNYFMREVSVAQLVTVDDPIPAAPAMTRSWEITQSDDPALVVGTTGTGPINQAVSLTASGDQVTYRVTDTVTAAGVHANTATIDAVVGGPFTNTSEDITFEAAASGVVECNGFRDPHDQQVIMQGIAHNAAVTDNMYFRVGTAPGGPYNLYVSTPKLGDGTDPQAIEHVIPQGDHVLTAGTQYYFIITRQDGPNGTILDQSAECTFTTSATPDYIVCLNSNEPRDRNQLLIGADRAGELDPATSGNPDTLLYIETGPSAAGPWTEATLDAGDDYSNPQPNPVPSLIGSDAPNVTGLLHDTTYFTRITLRDALGVDVETIVCGPYTTMDRSNPTCGVVSAITQTGASINVRSTPAEPGGAGSDRVVLQAGDVVDIQVSTTSGGPYVSAGTATVTAITTNNIDVPLTGLIPDTDYFYRTVISEDNESNAVYWTSPECGASFRTLAEVVPPTPKDLPVDCEPACAPNTAGTLPVSPVFGTPADAAPTPAPSGKA